MRTCSSETDPISSLLLLISLWCRKGLFTPASVLQEERDDRGGVTRPVCNEKTSFVGAEAPPAYMGNSENSFKFSICSYVDESTPNIARKLIC